MSCFYGIHMGILFPQIPHTVDGIGFPSHAFSIASNLTKMGAISVPYHHPTFPYHFHVWARYGPTFAISFPYFFFGKGSTIFDLILSDKSSPVYFHIIWVSLYFCFQTITIPGNVVKSSRMVKFSSFSFFFLLSLLSFAACLLSKERCHSFSLPCSI